MSNTDFVTIHQEALCEVMDLMGSCFTYKGAQYKGIISALELSTEFEADGGLWEIFGTQVITSKAGFEVAPVAGETLYIGNQKARIKKVSEDEVSYTLVCVSASK